MSAVSADATPRDNREATMVAGEVIDPDKLDGAAAASGATAPLARRLADSGGTLSRPLPSALLDFAQRVAPGALGENMLGNEKLISFIAGAQIYNKGDTEAVRQDIGDLLTGETSRVVGAAKKLIMALSALHADREIWFLLANMLFDKNANELLDPQLRTIIIDLLGKIHPGLSASANSLLSDSSSDSVKLAALNMLFADGIIRPAMSISVDSEHAEEQLLFGMLVLKLFTRIMVHDEKEKYKVLRNNIMILFARQIYLELNQEEGTEPRPLIDFMTYPGCDEVATELLLATSQHLVDLERDEYSVKDVAKADKDYVEAAESMLSFACLHWPEKFFGYVGGHYQYVSDVMRASFLYAMAYAVTGLMEISPDRLPQASQFGGVTPVEFILAGAIELSDKKAAQRKSADILRTMPKFLVAYLSGRERYSSLNRDKRKVLFNILLNAGLQGRVGRIEVLPFLVQDLKDKVIDNNQRLRLFRDFLKDDGLTELLRTDEKYIPVLHGLIDHMVENYSDFKDPTLAESCWRFMAAGGFYAIKRCHDFATGLKAISPELAGVLFLTSARIASVYETIQIPELTFINDRATALLGEYLPGLRELAGVIGAHAQHGRDLVGQEALIEEKEEQARQLLLKIRVDEPEEQRIAGVVAEVKKVLPKVWQAFQALLGRRKLLEQANEQLSEQEQTEVVTAEIAAHNQELEEMRPRIEKLEAQFTKALEARSVTPDDLKNARHFRARRTGYQRLKDEIRGLRAAQDNEQPMAQAVVHDRKDGTTQQVSGDQVEEWVKKIRADDEGRYTISYVDTNDQLKIAEACEVLVSDTAKALRLFLASPSIYPETAVACYQQLSNGESQDLITALLIAVDPRFSAKISEPKETEEALARLLTYQAGSQDFRGILNEELRLLTSLVRDGKLVPQDPENPLIKAVSANFKRTTAASRDFGATWNRYINDFRLGFLMEIFASEEAPLGVKSVVLEAAWEGAYRRWLTDWEKWDTSSSLNINVTSLVSGLATYFANTTNPKNMASSAYYFAIKVNKCADQIGTKGNISQHVVDTLEILEGLLGDDTTTPDNIKFDGPVKPLVQAAITKIKANMAKAASQTGTGAEQRTEGPFHLLLGAPPSSTLLLTATVERTEPAVVLDSATTLLAIASAA